MMPKSPSLSLDMVDIVNRGQTGAFTMGSTDDELEESASLGSDEDYYTYDEQPPHRVTLSVPFAMSRYQTTNEQYCAVMNRAIDRGDVKVSSRRLVDASSGRVLLALGGDPDVLKAQRGIVIDGEHLLPAEGLKDHPVNDVSWYGAVAFANYLSEISGYQPVYDLETGRWDTKDGYRLPTEAEWEYAARGSTRRLYAWGDEIDDSYVSHGETRPVGHFDGTERGGLQTKSNASPFGMLDMTGNVWEWVWDWYGRDYHAQSPSTDPLGPPKGDDRPPYHPNQETRVWRGGGWAAPIGWGYLRVAKRWSSAPDDYFSEVGFRVAQTIR